MDFSITAKDGSARVGSISTAHGDIQTPAFMPVATAGAVKALGMDDMEALHAQILMANTFHLHLKIGEQLVGAHGGLHGFSSWHRPFMTDSGGFQAFSLGFGMEHGVGKIASIFPDEVTGERREQGKAGGDEGEAHRADGGDQTHTIVLPPGPQRKRPEPKLARVTEEGVRFRSPFDGRWVLLTPEESMRIQHTLGADLILAFDECTSPLSDKDYTATAMRRTHRWAQQCLDAHHQALASGLAPDGQGLYGIVQGGAYEDLRRESAKAIVGMRTQNGIATDALKGKGMKEEGCSGGAGTMCVPPGFDGIAIGGSLGKSKQDMLAVLDWTIPLVPDELPRHLLGIGTVEDIFWSVSRGIDTFDCVMPTRIARSGHLLLHPRAGGTPRNKFRTSVKLARWKASTQPLDSHCGCQCCRHSMGFLRHLFMSKELLYYRLASIHNLTVILGLMSEIRDAISRGRLLELKTEWMG
ncbi:hypothetical protein AUJ68_04585 [Candidatus Woesearchaeota archaeon CG1_02_57_44]|nr:MAG: hypothetical protein AUJ68_04585 [Candidatus Woesearchaeota archaeon CG1_02_57_44]